MNAHVDKIQENKRQPVSAADFHNQNGSESIFQFEDNRPEAIAQRKLQQIMRCADELPQRGENQSLSPVPIVNAGRGGNTVLADCSSVIVQRVKAFDTFLTESEQADSTVNNSYFKQYLKNILKPIANKGGDIKSEVFYQGKEEYSEILVAVDNIGARFQQLFDYCLDHEEKNHTVVDLQQRLMPIMADLTLIEAFIVPVGLIGEAYAEAAFSGSYDDFVVWVSEIKEQDDYADKGSAIAVMVELEKNFPMTFEWLKPDIMCTRDKRFFIKEDVYGDRVAAAEVLQQTIEQYQLQKTAGPEKTAMVLGGKNVAIVKGMPLDEVDDMEVEDQFTGVELDALAEIGFLIVMTGVGDAAPVNIRKLQGQDKHAFIDTGGHYAHTTADDALEVDAQIEVNYTSFLDNLSAESRLLFKPWADLERPLEGPAAVRK